MASLKDIKKRISSVKNTQKITRAMKLVSAAKLRKATERAQASKPYEEELRRIVSSVLHETEWSSDLIRQRPLQKVALLLITPDKGLCGSLVSNILKAAGARAQELQKEADVRIVALGKKGREFFKKRDFKIEIEHLDLIRHGMHAEIAPIAKQVRELYLSGEFDRVECFYTTFKSALVQKPQHTTLLPFLPEECSEDLKPFLFEPAPSELLDWLVPMLIDFQVYHFVLESVASEHAARMTAMESARNNARDMIDRLTLQRNRARQAAITKELMEIISGAEALSA